MSAFQIIAVRVQDRASAGVDEYGDTPTALVDVAGSPFQARTYRGGGSGAGFVRQEEANGSTTIESRRVLSFDNPEAARVVRNGMIAIIPPCQANGYQEETVTIQRCRPYGQSLQCDLHTTGTEIK